MDCRKIEILIQMDIDQHLPEAWQQVLAEHISACPACAKANAELRAVDALLKEELPAVAPPADFAAAVMAALPEAEAAPKPQRRVRRFVMPAALTAVAAALILATGILGFWDFQPTELQPPQIAQVDPSAQQDDPELVNQVTKPPVQPEKLDPKPNEDPNPDDPDQTDPEDPTQNDPVSNDDPLPQDPLEQYLNGIEMPRVSSDNRSQGSYSQITLASYSDCDILSLRVSNGLATFYIDVDGSYYEWQVPTDGLSPASAIGDVESLPSTGGLGKAFSDAEISGFSAASPDGIYTAYNQDDGLWLDDGNDKKLLSELAGGQLVAWNADNDKLFFSDASGALHVYYISKDLVLDIASDVRSACWSGLNELVFTALDSSTGCVSLFRVTLP